MTLLTYVLQFHGRILLHCESTDQLNIPVNNPPVYKYQLLDITLLIHPFYALPFEYLTVNCL